MLQPYDIVTIKDDSLCTEIRGCRGYVISAVESDADIGVFIYELERVWCVAQGDVVATGARDEAARDNRGSPIRVSATGEVLG